MSMLSAQCDELRALAGDGSSEFIAGPIRADMLRMAADTIWELRCKLNDEQDENAKLRKLVRDTYDCICEMYRYMDGGYAYEDAEADPAYGPILKRMRELGVKP